MGLYNDWNNIAQAQSQLPINEQKKFWNTYFDIETDIYKVLLENYEKVYSGTITELSAEFDVEPITFMGFLDGINTSLKEELDLESLNEDSSVALDIDLEKLYFNMLDAKADWLYHLPQWDAILTKERRAEITKDFRTSKVYISENTVGRNDPCPCGSGKKYKKCCGAEKA